MGLKKIILLGGPTASGKSKLALKLAKILNGEIINADSMQIYKDFLILSSRPLPKDENKIRHHLYGFQSSKKNFSTGQWLKMAKKQINYCIKKKKIPIIVGGTGLYFKAITNGLTKIPHIKNSQRKNIRNLQKKLGQKKFYEKLIILDPLAKKFVNHHDIQRSLRAYEVKKFTKKSLYQWIKSTRSDFPNFEIKKIFIDIPKPVLLKNINSRVDKMFDNGVISEVEKFLKSKISPVNTAYKMIGILEIRNFLNSSIDKKRAVELIKIRTRQYAKRQFTWARGHMQSWERLYDNNLSVLLGKIVKEIA